MMAAPQKHGILRCVATACADLWGLDSKQGPDAGIFILCNTLHTW